MRLSSLLLVKLLSFSVANDVPPQSAPTSSPSNDSSPPEFISNGSNFTAAREAAQEEAESWRIFFPIDIQSRGARVVYNNDSEVVGFDMAMFGRPRSLIMANDDQRATSCSSPTSFYLGLPTDFDAWKETDVINFCDPLKLSQKQEMMINGYVPFYFKFRTPSGKYPEITKDVVRLLNTDTGYSLNGLDKITRLRITSDRINYKDLYDLLNYDGKTTFYIEAEYEIPFLIHESQRATSISAAVAVYLVVLIFFMCVSLRCIAVCWDENSSISCIGLIIPFTLLFVIVWTYLVAPW